MTAVRDMLGAARARIRWPSRTEGADDGGRGADAEREEARAAKDFERADAIRDELAELGWEVRDSAEGRSLVPARAERGANQIIYGRSRSPRRSGGGGSVHRVWRAPETPARGAGAALRVAGPPGGRGRGRSLSVRRPGGHAARARTRCWSRSTRCRTRATSAPSAARPSSPAPPGWSIPERRSAAVTAVACKASAGAVEHSQVAHVRNLADWLAEAKEAGFWIWGADAEAEAPPWDVDLNGPTVLVLGGEGKGIRPRVAAACDGLVALPRARPGRVAERLRGGHRAALRGRSASAADAAPELLTNATAVAECRNWG